MKKRIKAAVMGGRDNYTQTHEITSLPEYGEFLQALQQIDPTISALRPLVTHRASIARVVNASRNLNTLEEERERWYRIIRLYEFQTQYEHPPINRMTYAEADLCKATGRLVDAYIEQVAHGE